MRSFDFFFLVRSTAATTVPEYYKRLQMCTRDFAKAHRMRILVLSVWTFWKDHFFPSRLGDCFYFTFFFFSFRFFSFLVFLCFLKGKIVELSSILQLLYLQRHCRLDCICMLRPYKTTDTTRAQRICCRCLQSLAFISLAVVLMWMKNNTPCLNSCGKLK